MMHDFILTFGDLPGKNYNRNEGGGIKENDEGGEFSI
jgi:hypothetical protein